MFGTCLLVSPVISVMSIVIPAKAGNTIGTASFKTTSVPPLRKSYLSTRFHGYDVRSRYAPLISLSDLVTLQAAYHCAKVKLKLRSLFASKEALYLPLNFALGKHPPEPAFL